MTIYLYKKTHNKTGLHYLGKTTQNPYKYQGSGTYWKDHIKIHGKDITTEILRECQTLEEIKEWGMYYSTLWNIVEDKDEFGKKTWANLKPEAGDGSTVTTRHWNDGNITIFRETPPDDSFKLGRLPFNNFGSVIGANMQRGKIWIHNDHTEMMVDPTSTIPPGFVLGRDGSRWFGKQQPETHKQNGIKNHWSKRGYTSWNKGKKLGPNKTMWINNGETNLKIKVGSPLPIGFKKGRLMHNTTK